MQEIVFIFFRSRSERKSLRSLQKKKEFKSSNLKKVLKFYVEVYVEI